METKKMLRLIAGRTAQVTLGTIYVAAAVGAAPFDKGTLMKQVARTITHPSAGMVFSEIEKWIQKED